MDTYDDAVVGAGILGLAHAYHLAQRGRRVIVFERSPQASGASVRNFGMLWPIGQPAGPLYRLARRSREIWLDVLARSSAWHERTGSLHLAYRDDERQVLREFVAAADAAGIDCGWLDAQAALQRSPAIRPDGLLGAMWSPTEVCVDPRDTVATLPAWLATTYGVEFRFNCAVTAYAQPSLEAGGREWKARYLVVCPGDDLQSLFPQLLGTRGMIRCKLQMMRSPAYPPNWRIGPMLAAGLTLGHYAAFRECQSLPALRERFSRELPAYVRHGIHVMVSQNGSGELTIGDSHEYAESIEPFDKPEIDALILDYLNGFLVAPALRVASRWHGVYAKAAAGAYVVERPAPGVTVVTGVGGAGMTLSFGLAEQVVREMLGEPAAVP